MRKFWAIICTLAFSAFWVFGGLTVLAWFDAHPLMPLLMILSLAGLGVGVWSRLRLVAVTQDLARGDRVLQQEAAQL